MFRIILHRALIEPRATVSSVRPDGATLCVEGLLCSACAANVRGRLERVAGVSSVEVDLDRGEAHVSYDASVVEPAGLAAAVESMVILRPLRRMLAALVGHRRVA